MKLAAIVQARMGSTRFPGKVMADICGKPMLYHIVERVGMVISDVIIATTPDSKEVRSFAKRWGLPCFLGRLEADVLDRYYQCAKEYEIENIIRITGDNPLVDPDMINKLIDFYWKGLYDWAANCRLKVTYPVGNDAEIFTFEALEKASSEDLNKIKNIGPKTGKEIYKWFQDEYNRNFLDKLLKRVKVEKYLKPKGKLSGKIFVLTGALFSMSREIAKEKIRELGGKTSESISEEADYLVAGEEPGSNLAKAKKSGIKILDEKRFLKIIS